MSYLVVDQTVTDVDRWATEFIAATEQRRAAGADLVRVFTDPTEPGRLLVIVHFDTAEHARTWRTRPGTDDAADRVGLIPDTVTVRILEEFAPLSTTDQHGRGRETGES